PCRQEGDVRTVSGCLYGEGTGGSAIQHQLAELEAAVHSRRRRRAAAVQMKTSLPGHGNSRLLQWRQMGEIYVVAAGLKLEDAAGQVISSAARDLRAIEQQPQTAELRLMLRQIEISGQRFVGHAANFAAGD